MNSNKLLAIALATLLVLVSLSPSLARAQEVEEKGVTDKGGESSNEGSRRSGVGGFLSMLLSPFKATFASARRLFKGNLQNVKETLIEGFDEFQTKTFKLFMATYNRTYSSPEEIKRRMKLFFERRKLIQESIRDFSEGRLSFAMRENAFIDWDEVELRALAGVSPPQHHEMSDEERAALGASPLPPQQQLADGHESVGRAPAGDGSTRTSDALDLQGPADGRGLVVKAGERISESKDWRSSGCVLTPVNQEKCGACYAVATISVVESMRCLQSQSSSPALSPQQVVDCSRAYKNSGCDGGWPTRVLKYLQDERRVARETCYPFVRRANRCRLSEVGTVAGCTVSASPSDTYLRYKVLTNEQDILYHVANTGPVVTVMRALDSFLWYSRGIFDDPKCSRKREDVDHAIVIVGYGNENGVDYWLIKNSWGVADWGEEGYGRYRRGRNACSIGHWGWVVLG